MLSVWLKKQTAKFLIFVMMVINISPTFTMESKGDTTITIKSAFYSQTQSKCTALYIETFREKESLSNKSKIIFDTSRILFEEFSTTIEGIGKFSLGENNTINIDIDIDNSSDRTLKLITDRNLVINSLKCSNIKIIAPKVKFRGKVFVKSLGIKIFTSDTPSIEIEETAKISAKEKITAKMKTKETSLTTLDSFNFCNKGIIETENSIFLKNIGYFRNEGSLFGKNIELDTNVLENLKKIDGTTLAITAYKSILNNGEIKSKTAKFVVTSSESTSTNSGKMCHANLDMQIVGTFQNNGSIEVDTSGKFAGKITKLINRKKFTALSGKLTIDSGENYNWLKLETLEINDNFKNNNYLHLKNLLGAGEFDNYSSLSPYAFSEVVIGVKKFVNESNNVFSRTLHFINSIETLENKGTLSADSIIFDSSKLKIKNEKNATIKAAEKIEGEVENFENKGYFFSKNSFISLFFEAFMNRGDVGALKGVVFSGNILRNYGNLALINPNIKWLFNGESITDEIDDAFFANLFPAKSKQTAEEIFGLPEEERAKAIADILTKVKDTNLLKSEYAHLSAFLKRSEHLAESQQYSPKLFSSLFARDEFRELILHLSIDDLNRTNLEEVYLQNMIDSIVSLPENNSFRANLNQKMETLLSMRFNPLQLWLAKDILPEIQAAIKETEKKEFEDYYKNIGAENQKSLLINELKRVISASERMNISKTSANLRVYSGSSIKTLENTGHVEFISGINPVDRYIGTEASELLIPSTDDSTVQSEHEVDISKLEAKDKVVLIGKNTKIVIPNNKNVPNHSLNPISVYQEEYEKSVFKRKIGNGELFAHSSQQKNDTNNANKSQVTTSNEPLLTEEQFAKERQGIDATQLAYCINWNENLLQKLQNRAERRKILIKYALSYKDMADLLIRDMHIAKMKGATQLAENIKKCFIDLVSDKRAWVFCYYSNIYDQQYTEYQHNRTECLLFGGTAPAPVKIPTRRGVVHYSSIPDFPAIKLPSVDSRYIEETKEKSKKTAKIARKKAIAKQMKQWNSNYNNGTVSTTATAVSFGILEGRGKFHSHKMRIPSWQQFNEAAFLTREMEILGAINNNKNIAMPMTKLILDMQGTDFHNEGEIVCKGLFAKNSGIFDNRGIIEAYGNIEVHANEVLNGDDKSATVIKKKGTERESFPKDKWGYGWLTWVPSCHPRNERLSDPIFFNDIDFGVSQGTVLKGLTTRNYDDFYFYSFGNVLLKSNSGRIIINGKKQILNKYSSIIASNGFILTCKKNEQLSGNILNEVGRIISTSADNYSYIKALSLEQTHPKTPECNIGTFNHPCIHPWGFYRAPAHGIIKGAINIYDNSTIYSRGNLHIKTQIKEEVISEKNNQTPINAYDFGINAAVFLAKFGLRLSKSGEIVEDSKVKKYSIASNVEINVNDFVTKINERKQVVQKTSENRLSFLQNFSAQHKTGEANLSPKEELAKTVFNYESKIKGESNSEALETTKNIEKEISAEESKILDTLKYIKNINDNLSTKIINEIGKDEIEKIISASSSDSKNSRDKLVPIIGDTTKELIQIRKENMYELEQISTKNPIFEALLRTKRKIIDSELSQYLLVLKFLEGFVQIEEEEKAIKEWKIDNLKGIYLSTDGKKTQNEALNEIQIREKIRKRVSRKFDFYRDNYKKSMLELGKEHIKVHKVEAILRQFYSENINLVSKNVLEDSMNNFRTELISILVRNRGGAMKIWQSK